jgi:hypothetical protein
VAADFYISVLKTPSVHCAIVSKATGSLVGIVPLENITFNAISCFDEANINIDSKNFAVIASTGKHFNHARSPHLRGDIKADPTEISVRGIWADKILAMDYLMKREMKISTFDDFRSSFIDHAEFKDQILEAILGIMSDKITLQAELVTATGEKVPLEHTFEIGNTHNITKSFNSGLNRFLGISRASTDMRELAFPMIKTNLLTADDDTVTIGLAKSLAVTKVGLLDVINESIVSQQAIIKDTQGRTVAKYVTTENNILANSLLSTRALRIKLEKHSREKLIEIYLARKGEKLPELIPEELKEVYEMDIAKLLAFLNGQMPDDSTLNRILSIMNL